MKSHSAKFVASPTRNSRTQKWRTLSAEARIPSFFVILSTWRNNRILLIAHQKQFHFGRAAKFLAIIVTSKEEEKSSRMRNYTCLSIDNERNKYHTPFRFLFADNSRISPPSLFFVFNSKSVPSTRCPRVAPAHNDAVASWRGVGVQ